MPAPRLRRYLPHAKVAHPHAAFSAPPAPLSARRATAHGSIRACAVRAACPTLALHQLAPARCALRLTAHSVRPCAARAGRAVLGAADAMQERGAVAAHVPHPIAPEALGSFAASRERRACRGPLRGPSRRGRRAGGRRACRACRAGGACRACRTCQACRACGTSAARAAWAWSAGLVGPHEVATRAALVEGAVGVGGGARGELLARAVPLRARVSRRADSAGSRLHHRRDRPRLRPCSGDGDRPLRHHAGHPHEELAPAELACVELTAWIRSGR